MLNILNMVNMKSIINMINTTTCFSINNIILFMKIVVIYILLLLIFYSIQNKHLRFIYVTSIYLLCTYLFNINYKISILYVIIAICCVITESIYINLLDETWKYINPDVISIPYWLIPIWSIAILLIVESVNAIKSL